MPRRQHPVQSWTILSVFVRTRDGPDRLDHAYHRLCHRRRQPADRGRRAMRAAIYARVSTERQERQQTIDSQIAALSAWADRGRP